MAAYFGCATPLDVARRLHLGELASERVGELARVVFAAADDDDAAAEIVAHLAEEVICLPGRPCAVSIWSKGTPDVVLGGGLIRAAPASVIERIDAGIHAIPPGPTSSSLRRPRSSGLPYSGWTSWPPARALSPARGTIFTGRFAASRATARARRRAR